MAKPEVLEFIRNKFEQQEKHDGQTNYHAIALSITGKPSSPVYQYVAHTVLRMPTQEFLYPGAKETLGNLLSGNDHVMIWTQGHELGQLWKIASSRLGDLRRKLPQGERKRFSVHVRKDKISTLPSLIENAEKKGIKNIVIVDDKASNILNTASTVAEARNNGQISSDTNVEIIWINQGRTKDQVPEGYTPQSFKNKFTTIEDVRELTEIKKRKIGKTVWLIDYDHTLVNTGAAKEKLFADIAAIIEDTQQKHPIISQAIDLQLGLNGGVRKVENLKSGMSEGRVIKIVTDEGAIVAKYNNVHHYKIHREIEGYELLEQTPLGPHMLKPRVASKQKGLLVLPFFNGQQMRKGIKTGEIPEDLALDTLSRLLTVKKDWWSTQSKTQPNGNLVSMQRREWCNTLARVNNDLRKLSEQFGIPVESLWNSPTVFRGTEHLSLKDIGTKIAQMLKQYPPYAVLVHGDATGANVLVDPKNKEWKIIDAEWTGYGDPAEAFVRMIKYISTTTSTSTKPAKVREKDGKIYLEFDMNFPSTAIELQNYGLSKMEFFAQALNDPDFTKRSFKYLAGSYFRELALASKRGTPETAFFAMIKAAEAIAA